MEYANVDHRWSSRQDLVTEVRIYAGGEKVGNGKTVNLGIGGACIELDVGLKQGANISIVFTSSNKTFRLPCVVIWTEGNKAGVMFTDFNVETVYTLRDVLYPAKAEA